MRIIWNEEKSWFQAELTPGNLWRNDKDSIQAAGFRTEGPPSWIWYTTSSKTLNKLRESKPQSGLTITELALQKYQALEKKAAEKTALKKQVKKIKKDLGIGPGALHESKYYFDRDMGFECVVVEPKKSDYKWVAPKHPDPPARCVVCGDGLYWPDFNDICLWCDNLQKSA